MWFIHPALNGTAALRQAANKTDPESMQINIGIAYSAVTPSKTN